MFTTESDRSARRLRVRTALLSTFTVAGVLVGMLHATPAHADVPFDQKMLELVNTQRSAAGIAPLQWSDSLGSAAEDAPYNGCGFTVQGRAKDMGVRNYFSHNILGCLTQNVFNLLGGLGIVSSSSGENIAWMNGTTDSSVAAQRLMSDLMNSPGHRANILDPDFTQIGIGSWRTSAGQTWAGAGTPLTNVWITAQIFGRMATTAAPAAATSVTSLSFGDWTVGGTTAPQAVTVTNSGNAALSFGSATISGANASDFVVTANGCTTVAAGGSCTITLAFAPGSPGPKSASLQISDNAAGSPQPVALAGNGTAAPLPVLPGIPGNVQATGGDAQISVTWGPVSSGPAVDQYAVYLWNSDGYAGQNNRVCGSCLNSTFAGVPNGRAYYITVYGHDAAGWGSPGYSTWTTVASQPGAALNVQLLPGDGQATAKWTPPTSPSAAIDGYGVFIYDFSGYTGKSAWVCAGCTTSSVSGLSNGRPYYAMVYAHNPLGWGAAASSSAIVVGTPGPATNVVAIGGAGQASVTWTAASSSGAAIDKYGIVSFDSNGYLISSTTVCGTCSSGTVTGLTSGRSYTIWIFPNNAFGPGTPAPSNVVTVG
ncbi:MAG: choice-of-anchor D domain-containing protein [Actinomycetota bacterium]|nr:choice-of-anchor D domain-containing protein [Actinomycetota bacterium]